METSVSRRLFTQNDPVSRPRAKSTTSTDFIFYIEMCFTCRMREKKNENPELNAHHNVAMQTKQQKINAFHSK